MPEIDRFKFAEPVVPAQVEAARADKLNATKFGLLVSLAPAATVVAIAPVIPAGIKAGVSAFSGVHFVPRARATVSPRVTVAAGALYLAPIPAGVVPPEVYGIDPSIVPHTVGNFPGQKTIGFKASEVREQVYNARERETLIIAYLRRGGNGQALGDIPTDRLISDVQFLRATVHQEESSGRALEILERKVVERGATLPERVNVLPVMEPEATKGQNPFAVRPVAPPPRGVGGIIGTALASVPDAPTFHPALILPGNLLAWASAAAAEGIRKELATERADP